MTSWKKAKAREIASSIGHADFRASYGWLQRFSKRSGLNICGEGSRSNSSPQPQLQQRPVGSECQEPDSHSELQNNKHL